jgi:hypothetical protein
MSRAALSIRVFAFYLLATAATLMFVPNVLLRLLGIVPTEEHWIRMMGMLTGLLAYYYWRASAENSRPFFEWTVLERLAIAPAFFVLFVLLGWAAPVVLIFAVPDIFGALWTRSALKKADRFGLSSSNS